MLDLYIPLTSELTARGRLLVLSSREEAGIKRLAKTLRGYWGSIAEDDVIKVAYIRGVYSRKVTGGPKVLVPFTYLLGGLGSLGSRITSLMA